MWKKRRRRRRKNKPPHLKPPENQRPVKWTVFGSGLLHSKATKLHISPRILSFKLQHNTLRSSACWRSYTNYVMCLGGRAQRRARSLRTDSVTTSFQLPPAPTRTSSGGRVRSNKGEIRALTWSAPPLEPHDEFGAKTAKSFHHERETQNIRLWMQRDPTELRQVSVMAAEPLPLQRFFTIKGNN